MVQLRTVTRFAATLALAAAVACDAGSKPPPARNLLLITIDTLRADRIGFYGCSRPTSPDIDAFLASSVAFDDAQACSSWTIPAVASLVTGVLPWTHGCAEMHSQLGDGAVTLAEILAGAGFATGGIFGHVFFEARYGLTQGVADADLSVLPKERARYGTWSSAAAIAEKARGWLAAAGTRPQRFFLWLHFFDPHREYVTHPGTSEAFGTATPSDLYDGEVRFTDEHVGSVLRALDLSGVGAETVVVLIADHGEEFFDHGSDGHGKTLHEEVLRVPFGIRAPGFAPRRVGELVSGVDLLPTLVELLGLPPQPGLAGRSLVPAMRGDGIEPRPALAWLRHSTEVSALLTGRYKLMLDRFDPKRPRVALYDRASDPHEREDLAPRRPEVAEKLRAALESFEARARAAAQPGAPPVELSPADLDVLRQLGYVR